MKNLESFWIKVNKNGPLPDQSNPHYARLDKCWIWTASKSGGYGTFWFQKKVRKAHRVSWEIHKGSIPKDLRVLHQCDEPSCVNPSHLWLGTQEDNIHDMDRKGRGRKTTGENHWTYLYPEKVAKGSNHPISRLSDRDISNIRQLYSTGKWTQCRLAYRFGLKSQTSISRIVTRQGYK